MDAVNLRDRAVAVESLYVYEKVGKLNDHALRVVNVADRTLDLHVHEDSDEMFYVIEGSFQLETGAGLTPVGAGELVIVPKGTPHRPVVTSLCRFLLIERDGTLNKDNSGEQFEE